MTARRRSAVVARLARCVAAVCVTPMLLLIASPVPAVAATRVSTVCHVTDSRLSELSGLAAAGGRWYAINDGGDRVEVFVLDRECHVQRVITAAVDPYDPEDLALAADGTLWLSDTGDNSRKRDTVALIAVDPRSGDRPAGATVYRLRYPDGRHDAEALLLARDGTPYILTKELFGPSGVYRPSAPLSADHPVPLRRVGEVRFGPTGTPGGPVASEVGSTLVTGGAVGAGGSVVALRTYTDAYLFRVRHGDVVAALREQPVRIPLPHERQGEAIAFASGGTLLSSGEGTDPAVRAVRGAMSLVNGHDAPPATGGSAGTSTGQWPSATAGPAMTSGSGAPDGEGGWWLLAPAVVVIAALGWLAARRVRR